MLLKLIKTKQMPSGTHAEIVEVNSVTGNIHLADVFVMNVPTIAKTNIMSSYVINVEQPEQTAIGDVIVKKETEGSGQVYNLAGQAVQGTLAPGIYIRNGRKFIVR